jgi:hypothetical protein
MRRIGTWTAAAVLSAGLLSGCGGGGDTDAYCGGLEDAKAAFSGDMDATKFDELSDQVGELVDDAPDEVKGDWETLQGALDELNGALEDAGLTAADLEDPEKLAEVDPEDAAKIQEVAESLSSDETEEASDNIQEHAKDECDIDLS